MGCTGSSNRKAVLENNPLTYKQIQQRIEAPAECKSFNISGISIKYAWVSQRGYYPDAMDKENQDAFTVLPHLGKPGCFEQAFFGVYDGHGRDGHQCARYVRDKLSNQILETLERTPNGSLTSADIKKALMDSHIRVNENMHAERNFDDSLSGTTSISLLLRGRTMYISNVGDSRAILVSLKDGRLVAKPLSNDQTPYRKDERDRIKKTGARVLSMDQIEGIEPVHENWGDLNLGEDIDEGGDPPRVWSAKGAYPGTAFTRSIGDRIAEGCGVYAEPEILERDLEPDDKFIIIASDGVFEFLTNQMVADEVALHEDPLAACKAIVAQAYHLWLQYEVRTDDITMIALYLGDVATADTSGRSMQLTKGESAAELASQGEGSSGAHDGIHRQVSLELGEQRPVRRVMSREKRKNMIEVQVTPEDESEDELTEMETKALIVPKSAADVELIEGAIKSNFLFQHLNAAQRQVVIDMMLEIPVKKGDRVIRQGDRGDRFYVVSSGRFEVRVRAAPPPSQEELARELALKDGSREKSNSVISASRAPSNTTITAERAPSVTRIVNEPNPESLGNVVHVYESGNHVHPGFGELSLMYGKPRAASVLALTDGKLWALDRRVFRRAVLRPKDNRRNIIRTLKKVELLKCLHLAQLQRLTDLLSEESYSAGSYIIRQGEAGENFYLIVSGTCDCTINNPNGQGSKVVLSLRDNDYFGERALLEAKPRAANVIATSDTKVLYIGKSSFEQVLGPLSDIIDADRQHREALAELARSSNVPQKFSDVAVFGMVTTDVLGPLMLGTFGVPISATTQPNVTVRSFVLTQIERKSLKDSLGRFMEGVKAVQAVPMVKSSVLVPRPLCFLRDSNAVHIVFNQPIVADLSTIVRSNSTAVTVNADLIAYSFACLVSALEALHGMQILYRAVQPESLYVDSAGRVVLLDYRVCKVGLAGNARTYTICGVSDYLAPEQIDQSGHSYPADLWALGVLLYEILVGTHPFSSNSEVATYSKISSFGTQSFPALTFPATVGADAKALINQLLVSAPSARIGAGTSGFTALRRHPFFKKYHDNWAGIASGAFPSPLAPLAKYEQDAMKDEVVPSEDLADFTKESTGRKSVSDAWLDSLAF